MELPFYQVDAFTKTAFSGNPAAVVPLSNWIDDTLMQQIALEKNLSETAFVVPTVDGYHIRWFTPKVEVNLCGHATLASAFIIFKYLQPDWDRIKFDSKSGPLFVWKEGDLLCMDFPTDKLERIEADQNIITALQATPVECFKGRDDIMYIYDNPDTIKNMEPDFNALKKIPTRGFLVSAPGFGEYDFVSRGFFPITAINEDPATGSAHTSLCPYWSDKLGKSEMTAYQMSERGGYLTVENKGNRTILKGKATLFASGNIHLA
jgi:PhzF family phenazine biosynthesis protein